MLLPVLRLVSVAVLRFVLPAVGSALVLPAVGFALLSAVGFTLLPAFGFALLLAVGFALLGSFLERTVKQFVGRVCSVFWRQPSRVFVHALLLSCCDP